VSPPWRSPARVRVIEVRETPPPPAPVARPVLEVDVSVGEAAAVSVDIGSTRKRHRYPITVLAEHPRAACKVTDIRVMP
jgi:hypothetical protein